MSDAIRYFFEIKEDLSILPRQASEVYCFAQVEVVHNSIHFVEKSYCFQNIKAWEWDLAQTTTAKNAIFAIPTNTVPNLTTPW